MIDVIDNFLPEMYLRRLQNTLLSENFPWYFIQYKTDATEIHDLNKFQFSHTFCNRLTVNSSMEIVRPFIDMIEPIAIYRVKANLQPITESHHTSLYHVDGPTNNMTSSIFYLNTNNGYTLFRDGTKIESIENRFVTFDASLEHCATTCTDTKCRVVINFNYFK